MNPSTHLILHRLDKEAHAPATLQLRDRPLPANPLCEQLASQLHDLYSARSSKGYGRFEDDEIRFPTVRLVREYVQQQLDFVAFSHAMMHELKTCIDQEESACGGQVLFARLQQSATSDSLLLAIIPESTTIELDAQLDMHERRCLDLAGIRIAGRIDLAAWQSDSGRYISFLKGRAEVADYFKAFLGCNDVVAALKETQKLIKGIEHYAQQQQLPQEQRDTLFQEAHSYLDGLGEHHLPLSVDRIVAQLCPDEPEALRATLANDELGLSNGFIPDRRAIRPLLRFKAAGPSWKLEFNRKSLSAGDVIYNRNNDTIVLYNIPETLKKELGE
jgi:nucleoid-associated protein